jgi:hypothetical protein
MIYDERFGGRIAHVVERDGLALKGRDGEALCTYTKRGFDCS